jgi:hypothetical protein
MKSLSPATAALATASLFFLATTLTMIFAFAVPYYDPPLKVDVSGYGTCTDDTINVTRAWVWTQHPAPLKVLELNASLFEEYNITDPNRYLDYFIGRNSVVWGFDDDLEGFTPASRDGSVLTLDRNVHVQGMCHFTLDSRRLDNMEQLWKTFWNWVFS